MEFFPVQRLGDSGFTEELSSDPRSVSRARRLVAAALEDAGHDSLVDVTTLLVSEVVTNAVLHAGTPIRLDCSWNESCVRVEVHDGSGVLPSRRHYDAEATTGRGLGLIAALAAGWGVEARPEGKLLWFEVGSSPSAADAGDDRPTPGSPSSAVTVQLMDASPALVLATIEYGDAVLREMALLSLGGELEDLLPDGWHLPQFDVSPVLDAAEEARRAGRDRAHLVLELPDSVEHTSLERLRLIDRADELARLDLLLVQPALPEIAACRHWIYSQIHEQAAGIAAQPWRLPEPLEPTRVAAVLPPQELESVLAATVPTLVADDANRIIHVNDSAGALLAWDPRALLGQRLTVLIPPQLREAHLAGFSRLQLTGESRILGRPVQVPALRRDGSCVEVLLTISAVDGTGGRRAFRASLERRFRGSSPEDHGAVGDATTAAHDRRLLG